MIHAIVTGHSRGLGHALAEQLLQRPARVLGISRKGNADLAARFPDHLKEATLDLSDTESLLRWLAGPRLREFLTGAQTILLLNNAGGLQPVGPVGTQDATAIARNVALNVTAPMILSDAVARLREPETDCRILHISSGVGRRPCAGWAIYSATKAALDHHARSAGLDNTPGLRIASIAPGVVDTDMQTEIRGSDPQKFPPLTQFLKLKSDALLSTPAQSAEKILRFALAADMAHGQIADVREL